MAGLWRPVFVLGALALFYFNCLVFVVQSFQKVPSLNALAPTGAEPIVGIVQAVVFVAFLVVGFFSVRRFRPTTLAM
jgi:Asp/Glu/hydantoin racemase